MTKYHGKSATVFADNISQNQIKGYSVTKYHAPEFSVPTVPEPAYQNFRIRFPEASPLSDPEDFYVSTSIRSRQKKETWILGIRSTVLLVSTVRYLMCREGGDGSGGHQLSLGH